jgi:hypothetical protein
LIDNQTVAGVQAGRRGRQAKELCSPALFVRPAPTAAAWQGASGSGIVEDIRAANTPRLIQTHHPKHKKYSTEMLHRSKKTCSWVARWNADLD